MGFYEQNVMREINFSEKEGSLHLACKSLTHGWSPSPSYLIMEKLSVKKMLEELFRDFIFCSQKIYPELLDEKLFRDWISLYPTIQICC